MDDPKANRRKRMTRRDFIKTSALIGTGALAASCGVKATETLSSTSQPATGTQLIPPTVLKGTTITIWTFFPQDNYKNWYNFVSDEFMKSHPGVTVKVEYPGFDLITKAKAAIAGGEGIADIYAMLTSAFGIQAFQNGLLEDLAPYYSKDSEWQSQTDLWTKVPFGNYRWPANPSGGIYSSNESLCTMIVWYWSDMFEKLGGFPVTTDGLIESAARIKKDLPDLQGLCSTGFADPFQIDYTWFTLTAKKDFSGEVVRECVSGKRKWTSVPAVRQTFELWKTLYDKGVWDPGVMQEVYDPDSKVLFKDRKVGMFFPSGPWMSGYVAAGDAAKLGAAYFPKIQSADPNTLGMNNDLGHVIWKVSPQQKDKSFVELRVELLKSMTSPDAQRLLFRSGIIPVWSGAMNQPVPDNPDMRLLKQEIDLMMKADYSVDVNPYYAYQAEALETGVAKILLGMEPIDQVLSNLDAAQAKDFPA